MKHFHADPADALRILDESGARHLLPVHHNTFIQSWDEPTDAVREFLRLRLGHAREGDSFVLRPGEQAIYEQDGQGKGVQN